MSYIFQLIILTTSGWLIDRFNPYFFVMFAAVVLPFLYMFIGPLPLFHVSILLFLSNSKIDHVKDSVGDHFLSITTDNINISIISSFTV